MQADLFGAISTALISREMITGVVGGVVASVMIGLAHWLVYRVKHWRRCAFGTNHKDINDLNESTYHHMQAPEFLSR